MYNLVLIQLFQQFLVFCSKYLMFFTVFPFSRFQRGLIPSSLLYLLSFIPYLLIQRIVSTSSTDSFSSCSTALGETHSCEQTNRRQFIKIKQLSSISIDKCCFTTRILHILIINPLCFRCLLYWYTSKSSTKITPKSTSTTSLV